jgi:mediator of RNA polymerase II transcription subunit 16
MPFIMDDQMQVDIDDLFDDTPGLALASKAPPKELLERLVELRGSGCCQ